MQPETYQKLGTKAFIFILIQKLLPAIALLIAIIILIILRTLNGNSLNTLAGTHAGSLNTALNYIILITTVLFLIILAAMTLWAWLEYITYTFMIGENALKIKKGIFATDEISIMYHQIQNVDIERPLLYKLLGLSRIVILTAGHEDPNAPNPDESEGVLDSLDVSRAESIQEELLKLSNIEEVVTVPASRRE